MQTEVLVEKINRLPLNRIAEVEDFVDFLTQREERRLVDSATKLSEEVFREVWDNEEDAIYDKL
ncbi:MAG: toxin-antitoxin system, antitoxin component, Xre family protein [Acidobacteriota bacterium]|nr:toxin-antitoxin system, antitoxin component, Xre family protein [Acidobacteriota bacterium]